MKTNQILFLFCTFILYLLFYIFLRVTKKQSGVTRKNIVFVIFIGLLFSLLTMLICILTGVYKEHYVDNNIGKSCTKGEYNTLKNYKNNRTFGNPNLNFKIDGRLCQGGAYMRQGSSKRAVACRQLASTPEGMAEIQRYNCGTGYSGLPGKGFEFTPIGEQCNKPPSTDVRDNGIF
jgi:hypothetical protein